MRWIESSATGSCEGCLLDDELNVIPISRAKDIAPTSESFVTSPSPENLKTRGYEEHLDYDIAVAHDLGSEKKEEFSKVVVRT